MYRTVLSFLRLVLLPTVFLTTINAQTTKTIGATGADYATVKLAFDDINAGLITGAITLNLIDNTTETASAVLHASGYNGTASYTSVTILPTVSGLSISGSLEAPLIDLDGADNVTIEGRLNGTGTLVDLTMVNTSTSSVAGTSTVRFINDATGNTVRYCAIKGSSMSSSGGILLFSTTTETAGNDANVIDHNTITNAGGARPLNALCSSGTSGKQNSGNTVSNNAFSNFFNAYASSNGISIGSNNTEWTIASNSFFETTSLTGTTGESPLAAIRIQSGNGYSVLHNIIGGSAADGSGKFQKSGGYNPFYGVFLSTEAGTVSTIRGNIIQNFDYSNGLYYGWNGFYATGGTVLIDSNAIGAPSWTNTVRVQQALSGSSDVVTGFFTSSAAATIEHNHVYAFLAAQSNPNGAARIAGFSIYGSSPVIVRNNSVSVSAGDFATSAAQKVWGMTFSVSNSAVITGNTITAYNYSQCSTPSVQGFSHAIECSGSTGSIYTVRDNTITDVTIRSANSSTDEYFSACGIVMKNSSGTADTITGNTISGISNTGGGNAAGIYHAGPASGSVVSGNFIHSLSASTSSTSSALYGLKLASGSTTCANNIISLNGSLAATLYGIHETGASGTTNALLFNTVFINGTASTGTNKSYCLYSSATANTRIFRNNILDNERSTAGGSSLHYALYFAAATDNTGLSLNYNDYTANGTGGMLGYLGGDMAALPLLSGTDTNSVTTDPGIAGGTELTGYRPGVALVGETTSSIPGDIADFTRPDPPTMGAIEKDNPLPIQLAAFTATAVHAGAVLAWQTTTETGNYGFEIERRPIPGPDWTVLGFVPGSGNSNTPKSYAYTDAGVQPGRYAYRLKQIDTDGSFRYSHSVELDIMLPAECILFQNYPNPFNPTTTISFSLPHAGPVRLEVYDLLGRLVAELLNEERTAGTHTLLFNGSRCPSGIYFLRFAAGDKRLTQRMMLIK